MVHFKKLVVCMSSHKVDELCFSQFSLPDVIDLLKNLDQTAVRAAKMLSKEDIDKLT